MNMRKIILLLAGCILAYAGSAQPSSTDLLTKSVWKIKSDEMSGVGVHTSLANDTELQFFSDGTWKSSRTVKEVSAGKWRFENNDRNLVMSFGNEETSYLILQLTENGLHYRLKKNAATYILKWVGKE